MNKVLDFFNKISGVMIFLILLIVFITHLQIAHFHHHGKRWHHDGRDSLSSPVNKDTLAK